MENKETTNAVLDNIMSRTSIRIYKDSPVEDEKVDALLHAAMAAPSACNKQPWRFVVVKEAESLARIGEEFQNAHMAKNAPLAIVVCGDKSAFFEGEGEPYWTQDCAAAIQNILLAAHALGLGAVWCGIYPISERVKKMAQLFDMPASIIPMAVVVIGYPAQSPNPKNKWNSENIHFEKW